MPSWPVKDPDTRADYRYNAALDSGDTILSITSEVLSGTVTIDHTHDDTTGTTLWLEGGTDGETAVFKISWVSNGGREFDEIITLPVAANEPDALALTGYEKPTAAHLIARYPAFAAVPVGTIRTWLTDAERFVDRSWAEGDYAAALMAKAAHEMVLLGLGTSSGAAAIPAGVTRFKSGAMDVTVSETAANQLAKGGYDATLYGREFKRLRNRNFAGPMAIATGVAPNGEIAA